MAQNSAGIKLGYHDEEADKNVNMTGITSIPDIGGEPETLETTTLDNLKYTSYIAGLQDLGGSFGFEANLTPELQEECNAASGFTETNKIPVDRTWFIYFPKPLDCHYYWTGALQPLPVTGVGVNEVVTTNLYITVQDEVQGPVKGEYAPPAASGASVQSYSAQKSGKSTASEE